DELAGVETETTAAGAEDGAVVAGAGPPQGGGGRRKPARGGGRRGGGGGRVVGLAKGRLFFVARGTSPRRDRSRAPAHRHWRRDDANDGRQRGGEEAEIVRRQQRRPHRHDGHAQDHRSEADGETTIFQLHCDPLLLATLIASHDLNLAGSNGGRIVRLLRRCK